MTRQARIAAVGAAAALFVGGGALGSQLASESSVAVTEELPFCGEGGPPLDLGLCGVQGTVKGLLYNMQGAAQFCKWRAANPGEWSRVKAMFLSPQKQPPSGVVTWFGASLRDLSQAYAYAEGAPYTIPPNTAPNACKTPLAPPTNVKPSG